MPKREKNAPKYIHCALCDNLVCFSLFVWKQWCLNGQRGFHVDDVGLDMNGYLTIELSNTPTMGPAYYNSYVT